MPVDHLAHRMATGRHHSSQIAQPASKRRRGRATRPESWTPPPIGAQLIQAANRPLRPDPLPAVPRPWPQNAFAAALMTLSTLELLHWQQQAAHLHNGTTGASLLVRPGSESYRRDRNLSITEISDASPTTFSATAETMPAATAEGGVSQPSGQRLTGNGEPQSLSPREYYQLVPGRPPQRLQSGSQHLEQFYQRYYRRYPPLKNWATSLLRERLKQRFNLDIDPDKAWFMRFNSAENSERTFTGWQHSEEPVEADTLTSYLWRNFPASAQEHLNALNSLCGIYLSTGELTRRFDEHNEVPILPVDFLQLIWDIDIYNQALARYNADYSHPQSHIKRAFLDLLVNLDSQRPDSEAAKDILMGTGLLTNQGVAVRRFDINGYQASDMLVFSNARTGRVTLYMPQHEQKFQSFRSLFEMRRWLVNNCADARHRDTIARHFSLQDRQDGIIYAGVDSWLRSLYEDIGQGNYLNRIASQGDDVPPEQFFTRLFALEKARKLQDLDTLIKSDAEVRRDTWEQDLDASLLLANPVSLLLSLSTHIEHALDGDSWQERQQEWVKIASDMVNIVLMAALDRLTLFDEEGSQLISSVRETLQTRTAEAVIDSLFAARRVDTVEQLKNRMLPTALPGDDIQLAPDLLQALEALPFREVGRLAGPLPDEYGLYRWRASPDSPLQQALVVKNRLYPLSPLATGNGWQPENGWLLENERQIVLLDRGWYLRDPAASDPIRWAPCRTRRVPDGNCLYLSEGLDERLSANLKKAFRPEELESENLTPYPEFTGLFENGAGKLYLKYRDNYFPVTRHNNRFTLYSRPSSRFIDRLRGRTITEIHFSQRYNRFYLTTPTESMMMSLGCSRPVAELHHFATRNKAQEKRLSSNELAAIVAYSSTGYDVINEFMLEGMPDNYLTPWMHKELVATVRDLRSGLQKLASYQGVVYRGTSLHPEALRALRPGDIVSSKKFISTSIDRNVARVFSANQPDGVLYTIETKKSAHAILRLTMRLKEGEVLIEDGALFTCVAVNGNEIHLRELVDISPAQASQVKILPL